MHKKFFEKRLAKLIAKRDSLTQKALASQDIEEIRSIQAQLADINSDIEDVQEALAAYDDEPAESRANVPVNGVQHNAGITASFSQTGVERAANGSGGKTLGDGAVFENDNRVTAQVASQLSSVRCSNNAFVATFAQGQ